MSKIVNDLLHALPIDETFRRGEAQSDGHHTALKTPQSLTSSYLLESYVERSNIAGGEY
jgi:hypothetical protein